MLVVAYLPDTQDIQSIALLFAYLRAAEMKWAMDNTSAAYRQPDTLLQGHRLCRHPHTAAPGRASLPICLTQRGS